MKNRKKKVKRTLKVKFAISIILVALLLCSFLFSDKISNTLGLQSNWSKYQTDMASIENNECYVSYINVGQGNSIYIKLPDNKNVLIDGGNIEYGETVAKFLNDHDVDAIDYMIATHADSDHIGGLNYVLENFEVKNIYRPFQIAGTGNSAETFVAYEYEDLSAVFEYYNEITNKRSKINRVTTDVYKQFIKNIYTETYLDMGTEKLSSVCVFYDGLVIETDDYKFEFYGPLVRDDMLNLESQTSRTSGYATVGYGASNSNDNSAIFTFSYKEEMFLFTGDATFSSNPTSTAYAELDFINSLTDIEKNKLSKTSVLILGHHGSKYSTSNELLELVLPRFIVISSGNEYGHPANETLERLNNINSLDEDSVLRTDTNGTIEFAIVGNDLMYALEHFDNNTKLEISYELLSSIFVLCVIIMIFSIKIKPARRR